MPKTPSPWHTAARPRATRDSRRHTSGSGAARRPETIRDLIGASRDFMERNSAENVIHDLIRAGLLHRHDFLVPTRPAAASKCESRRFLAHTGIAWTRRRTRQ